VFQCSHLGSGVAGGGTRAGEVEGLESGHAGEPWRTSSAKLRNGMGGGGIVSAHSDRIHRLRPVPAEPPSLTGRVARVIGSTALGKLRGLGHRRPSLAHVSSRLFYVRPTDPAEPMILAVNHECTWWATPTRRMGMAMPASRTRIGVGRAGEHEGRYR
jgi:hypothetical protein